MCGGVLGSESAPVAIGPIRDQVQHTGSLPCGQQSTMSSGTPASGGLYRKLQVERGKFGLKLALADRHCEITAGAF